MMQTNKIFLFFLSAVLITACSKKETYDSGNKIGVNWELLTNFTEKANVFDAKFTLNNNSNFDLTDTNWALFFNMAPREIVKNESVPAQVVHINGDWYKLVPEAGFSLKTGETKEIPYQGIEGVIKNTDRPLGLYFVFYDEEGEETKIVEVENQDFKPFTTTEQINRGKADEESIPTPKLRYFNNQAMELVAASDLLPIVPTPVSVKTQPGTLSLDNNLTIFYQLELEAEANYLKKSLKALTGKDFTLETSTPTANSIQLKVGQVKVNGKDKEAYRLTISRNGIDITGSDPAGVFYGIQSLRSLVPIQDYEQATIIELPRTTIQDAPRFGFRGLHVDVGRNFQSKETIMRMLDLISFYKLNRFLLYITEDEGWRLEIPGLPELTEVGAQRQHTSGKEAPALHPAYGSGPFADKEGNHGSGYYSREDFIEILKYAKERHITIIPEVNFPGHARAAIKSMEARYQRLMKEGKEEEAKEYRLIDPDDKSAYLSAQAYTDNVVSVARESTYHFYEKVVDEISKMYADAGLELKIFHTGGDEVPEGAWTQSPMAKKLLAEHPDISDPKNLQTYFFGRLLEKLEKRGLEVHGWEEIALKKDASGVYQPNPEFAERPVVPYIWNNTIDYPDLGYRLANFGYQIVLCNVTNFYFDLAYDKDPEEPGLYWAGFINTRNAWTFAPFDMFKTTFKDGMGRKLDLETDFAGKERLKPESRDNILGLEAQLWSETIKGRDMIEYYMLPKLLGFAESAWAHERDWETIENNEKREVEIDKEWNIFANTMARKELPRLHYLNEGYNYRLPLPGAIIEGEELKANVEFPGLTLRYTTDGTEPNENSPEYTEPVKVSGPVKLKTFDITGKSSRTVQVKLEGE